MKLFAALLTLICSLVLVPVAVAETVTLTTDGDSFVESGAPTGNRGTSANLRVQLGTTSFGEQQTYLEFPSPNIPAGSTGVSAVLRLHLKEVAGPKVVRTHTTGDFAESTLTWNNRPAISANPISSTTIAGPNGVKTLTVPSLNLQARNQYALTTSTNSGGTLVNMAFDAKEGTVLDPQLVVTYTPPPVQAECSDGVNNDPAEDSLIDFPADPGCVDGTDNTESPNPVEPPPAPECSDGVNNDTEDALVDFPADPGCSSAQDTTESPNPPPAGSCTNNATPSNFASQVTATPSGGVLCLASGAYGQWTGTNKAITIKEQAGATATMSISFGSGDAGFTLDGMGGMSGSVGSGASNITVKNSAFTSCLSFSGALTNVVFDGNSHNNINATCGNSRIGIGASSGLTIRNSQMIGGDADGTFVFGSGFVYENNYVAPCETGVTGNHTDGLQYADPGAASGGYSGVVRKNFFDNAPCSNKSTQMLTSYDAGTNGALWEDNVVRTTRNFGIELYADDNSVVRNNTVVYCASGQCVFGGDGGKIVVDRKPADPVSVGTDIINNVGTPSIAGSTTGHTVSGNFPPAQAQYAGPPPLDAWAKFRATNTTAGIRVNPNPPPPPMTDGDGDGVVDSQDQCPSVAGPASNNGCPVTPPPPPPAGVTNIQATNRTDTTITLTWDGPGTKVFRSNPDTYAAASGGSHTFTGLTPNTSYRLNVSWGDPETWGSEITASTTGTTPPPPPPPPPPTGTFRVGVTDREWFDNDVASQSKLGYKLVRYGDGNITAQHAAHYKSKGMDVVRLTPNSSNWTALRDEWNRYGPNGTVTPGIVIALEVGNEESMPHRTSDPYASGRAHAGFVRQLAAAVPDAPIVCQGDDSWQAQPDPRFFQGMRDANPQIAEDCDLYAIHPYGHLYRERMDRNRGHIDNILNDDGASFFVSEYGVAVRRDQPGCITDDSTYGCITLQGAADRLRTVVNYLKARGDVRWVTLYQNTDQQSGSGAREHNFGLLGPLAAGTPEKGVYTTAGRELIAANP